MEEEPIIVPHAQGEARRRPNEGGGGGGRGDGDDAGSNGSSEEGVLVSPSSSPEPELAAASSPPPSYPLRGSVVAGQGLYMIDTHAARDLTPELLKEIRAVHELCFPDEKSGDEEGSGGRADADWLQRATFCHEPADCAWILLYELDGEDEAPSSSPSSSSFLASWLPFLNKAPAASSPSEEEQQQQQQMKKKGELVGLVAGVPYSSSLFGFGLGVAPRLRGRGLGARLMHSLQAAARARNLSAISATVEGGKRGLVEYYKGHGGVVESAGVTSPDSAPPTVFRIVKRFDDEELARVTREADERIFTLEEGRKRRCRRRRGVAVAAAVSASVLAVAAVALALLRGRAQQQRRRLLK